MMLLAMQLNAYTGADGDWDDLNCPPLRECQSPSSDNVTPCWEPDAEL